MSHNSKAHRCYKKAHDLDASSDEAGEALSDACMSLELEVIRTSQENKKSHQLHRMKIPRKLSGRIVYQMLFIFNQEEAVQLYKKFTAAAGIGRYCMVIDINGCGNWKAAICDSCTSDV